ncbi:hypothetical protein I6N96_12650 [Enterococcus sp. BWM-S5]|uniref:Uncharacterized protein n=1 Tax=Enterococcus larvae TaxID=2794352 RepID=A0ABS4CLR6_9ENTE|nr:hypothetical protein [Enterococcus larvae]MBP1047123.1 hypothetical protein [Enterococcus larvae]
MIFNLKGNERVSYNDDDCEEFEEIVEVSFSVTNFKTIFDELILKYDSEEITKILMDCEYNLVLNTDKRILESGKVIVAEAQYL